MTLKRILELRLAAAYLAWGGSRQTVLQLVVAQRKDAKVVSSVAIDTIDTGQQEQQRCVA